MRICRSQWPHGLSHQMSLIVRTLGSWVRIPLKAWMSVSAFILFVDHFTNDSCFKWRATGIQIEEDMWTSYMSVRTTPASLLKRVLYLVSMMNEAKYNTTGFRHFRKPSARVLISLISLRLSGNMREISRGFLNRFLLNLNYLITKTCRNIPVL
jgi:hypothetical protein